MARFVIGAHNQISAFFLCPVELFTGISDFIFTCLIGANFSQFLLMAQVFIESPDRNTCNRSAVRLQNGAFNLEELTPRRYLQFDRDVSCAGGNFTENFIP